MKLKSKTSRADVVHALSENEFRATGHGIDECVSRARKMVDEAFPLVSPLPPVVQALVAAMAAHPSERIGQLMINALVPHGMRGDHEGETSVIWNSRDEEASVKLREYAKPVDPMDELRDALNVVDGVWLEGPVRTLINAARKILAKHDKTP